MTENKKNRQERRGSKQEKRGDMPEPAIKETPSPTLPTSAAGGNLPPGSTLASSNSLNADAVPDEKKGIWRRIGENIAKVGWLAVAGAAATVIIHYTGLVHDVSSSKEDIKILREDVKVIADNVNESRASIRVLDTKLTFILESNIRESNNENKK